METAILRDVSKSISGLFSRATRPLDNLLDTVLIFRFFGNPTVTSLNALLTVQLAVERGVDQRNETSQDYCSNYRRNFILTATAGPLHGLEDVHHVILVRPVTS